MSCGLNTVKRALWAGAVGLLLLCNTARAQDNQVDTTKTLKQEPYSKTTGEVLVAIPGQILLLPVRVLQAVSYGSLKLYEQPATQYLLSFESPRLYGAYPISSYGSNSGLKLGLVMYDNRLWTQYDRFKLRLSYTTHDYQHYEVYYRSRRLTDPGLGFQLLGRYRKRPRESFYGFGQDSRREDEVSYTKEESFVSGDLAWRLTPNSNLSFQVSYTATNITDGKDPNLLGDLDSIIVLFNGTDADVRPTRFWRYALRFLLDGRNVKGQPTSGFAADLGVAYQKGTGISESLEFTRARADLRYYLELFRKRTLEFRGLVNVVDKPADAPELPFYLFSELGGLNDLRAYRTGRLRDNDAALAAVDYRYPIWDVIDAFVFFEAGSVFNEIGADFSFRGWRTSYGLGFQIWHPESVLFKTQIAIGTEGVRYYFDFGTQLW
jgi:outer membrane protein assembly factor BamA